MILTYGLYFKHADVRLNKYKSVRCHKQVQADSGDNIYRVRTPFEVPLCSTEFDPYGEENIKMEEL